MSVRTTAFLDANLLLDLITGRSVTAVLHFFNLTPGDRYSKRQATVENATYRSEFVAAKTVTEQIAEVRQTLTYLGVPIKSKAYMFGDNKSVVTSSMVPHSLLSKRHNILSYHRVREAITAKILVFHWCDSSQNKSDILSKHWEFHQKFELKRHTPNGGVDGATCYSLETRLVDLYQFNNKDVLDQKHSKDSTINQRLVEQIQQVNFKLEVSGGSTLVDTLRKYY